METLLDVLNRCGITQRLPGRLSRRPVFDLGAPARRPFCLEILPDARMAHRS